MFVIYVCVNLQTINKPCVTSSKYLSQATYHLNVESISFAVIIGEINKAGSFDILNLDITNRGLANAKRHCQCSISG